MAKKPAAPVKKSKSVAAGESKRAPDKKVARAAEPPKKPSAKSVDASAKKPESAKASAPAPKSAKPPTKVVEPPKKAGGKPGAQAVAKSSAAAQKVAPTVKGGVKPPAGKSAALAKPVQTKGAAGKPVPGGKSAPTKPGKGESAASPPRFKAAFVDSMADSKAAAAKLASAAGISHIKRSRPDGEVRDVNAKRLTKTPLSKKQLAEFRELLLEKRRDLVGSVTSMESEALISGSGSLSHLPQHMADAGTDTFDQSLALDLAAEQRKTLKEIDGALQRIEVQTYGVCALLGIPIDIERLRSQPWAKYSIEAAREIERTGLPRE